MARLEAWADRSLLNRLRLATLALSLCVLLPVTALSFVLSWRLVRQDLASRQAAQAELRASRVALVLEAARASVAEVAASPLIATALVDAQGWQQYGLPYLRGHRLPIPVEARLALCDFRGRVLASSAEPPALAPLDWVDEVVERGRWYAAVRGQGAGARLLLVAPVRYAGTGTVEGSVAAEIPLGPLGEALLAGGAPTRLVGAGGRGLTGTADAWPGRVTTLEPVRVAAPFDALGLQVEAAVPPGAAASALAWLAGLHVAVALLVLGLGQVVAHRLSSKVARPLADLAEAAWVGSANPEAGVRVPVQGRGETARLAVAFNELLGQLEKSRQAVEAGLRSEKREAEDALRLAYGALEHSTDAITICAPSGVIAYANRAACRLLGRPLAEVVGRRTFEVDEAVTEPRWRQVWEALRATGRFTAEREAKGPDGPPRWLETTAHLVSHGGEAFCVLVMRDVSARHQAEAALRLAGVGTLAAGAAHEINNPLTSVMGNLSFLGMRLEALAVDLPPTRDGDVAEAREAMIDALHGAERVRDVVRGLKDFSRPDEEQQEPTDVAEVMRGAVRLARHDLTLLGGLAETYRACPPVLAARRRLEQVFVNLLVNGAQALQDAGGRGVLAVSVAPGADGEVVAEVRDDGPGMTPEVRARVFEPFFTTKPVGSGTGLGLAICHGIVAACGGHIDVESEPGRGSAFRVVLPAMTAAAEAGPADPPRPAAPAPAPGALPSSRRVLVVDDEPLVLRAVVRALGPGPEVVAVTDPHEALRRLLAGERFDLVLCDLMMPGLSGMDIHAALHEARPALATRVVFITGGAFTERAREFLASGPLPCVEKPFEPGELRRLVAERLRALDAGA